MGLTCHCSHCPVPPHFILPSPCLSCIHPLMPPEKTRLPEFAGSNFAQGTQIFNMQLTDVTPNFNSHLEKSFDAHSHAEEVDLTEK